MLKRIIPRNSSFKELKSNERGVCPVLPDFAHILKEFRMIIDPVSRIRNIRRVKNYFFFARN